MRPLAHRIGHHAIQSGRGQQQGQQSYCPGKQSAHTRNGQFALQVFCERIDASPNLRVELSQGYPRRTHEQAWIDFSAQQKFQVRLIRGIEWIIEVGTVHLRQFHTANASSYADDLIGRAPKASLESLTERIIALPKTMRECFVDDCDRRLVFNLLFAESSSLQQRNTQ